MGREGGEEDGMLPPILCFNLNQHDLKSNYIVPIRVS